MHVHEHERVLVHHACWQTQYALISESLMCLCKRVLEFRCERHVLVQQRPLSLPSLPPPPIDCATGAAMQADMTCLADAIESKLTSPRKCAVAPTRIPHHGARA